MDNIFYFKTNEMLKIETMISVVTSYYSLSKSDAVIVDIRDVAGINSNHIRKWSGWSLMVVVMVDPPKLS